MATMRGLRRQISELQRELDRLSETRQNYVQAAEENYRRQLAQLEHQMEQMRASEVRENRARYNALKQELLRAQDEAIQEIRRESEAAARRRGELLDRLTRAHQELEAEKNRLVQECLKEKQRARAAAQELCREAQQEMSRASAAPHEFFFPGQMELIAGRMAQIEQSMRQEMYQAAASIAASAATEAGLLTIRTRQKLAEWEEMFRDYAEIAGLLMQQLRVFETSPVETPAGSFVLARRECDFWSRGEYGVLADEIRKTAGLVRKLEQGNLVQALKAGSLPKGYALLKSLKEISRVGQSFASVTECIVRERIASDERFTAADKIAQMMDEYGYSRIQGGFLPVGEKNFSDPGDIMDNSREENPADSFVLTVWPNTRDRIVICIAPRRDHGISSGNACLVALQIETVPDEKLIDSLRALYAQRIREATGLAVEEIPDGQAALQQRENSLKKQIDIKKYEEYRQRHAGKEIA